MQQNLRIDSSAYSCKSVEKCTICEIYVWELAINGFTFACINSSINLKPSLKSNVKNIETIDVLSPDKSNNFFQLG